MLVEPEEINEQFRVQSWESDLYDWAERTTILLLTSFNVNVRYFSVLNIRI